MQLTCEVYTTLVDGRTMFYGRVHEGGARLWEGKPVNLYADAAAQAEKAANRIFRSRQAAGLLRPPKTGLT